MRIPKIHSRFSLIDIGFSQSTYTTFTEEDADEAGIIFLRPIFNRKNERIREIFRWIAKFQVPINS